MVDARHTHPFADDAEIHTVVLLPRVGGITSAVQVQNHVIFARPFSHALNRGVANHQINHDNHAAERFGEFGTLVHIFHRAGGNVEVVPLHLAGRSASTVHRFHAVKETIAPVHKRLRVNVLVVLHEVETAPETLIDDATIVAA